MKGLTHKQTEELKDAMREYKAQGHSMQEVAERFGYSYATTEIACRGISPQKPKKYKNQYTNGSFDREANAREMVDERTPWFEYVGNFTGADGTLDLKCKTCGTVTTKSCVTVRHGKARCETCYRKELARIAEEKKEKAKHQKELEREHKRHIREANKKAIQLSFSLCECCGKPFFPKTKLGKYCSTDCLKKVFNSLGKDKRLRKLKDVFDDKDITLRELFIKNGGRCAICGNNCNWDDCEEKDGAFVAHGNYPSIDHIIPLSKGGRHTWSNVQLACISCNSKKGNRK